MIGTMKNKHTANNTLLIIVLYGLDFAQMHRHQLYKMQINPCRVTQYFTKRSDRKNAEWILNWESMYEF